MKYAGGPLDAKYVPPICFCRLSTSSVHRRDRSKCELESLPPGERGTDR